MPSLILSDNGLSSGSAGLKSTAGNDGILILQTANSSGTATNAVYVNATQQVAVGASSVVAGYRMEVDTGSSSDASNPIVFTARNTTGQVKRLYIQASGLDSTPLYTIATGAVGTDPIIAMAPAGTEAFRFKSGGTLILAGGSTSATGTGITFPATQSASSDVNTLDDYEEGTWTPTGNGVTFASASGIYTKIGNICIATYYALWPVTSNTSPARISGLPFTTVSNDAAYGSGQIGLNDTGLTIIPFVERGNTFIFIRNVSNSDYTNANISNKSVAGCAVYRVA